MRNDNLLSINRKGEIVYHGLNAYTSKKYKADTPLDKSFVPYMIMAFCAVVDASVFISLFKMISYDSPFMLGIEVAGFLFAFDVVPLYLGIQLRRIKQGLNKDRFIMWLALAVCITAFLMNVVLRIITIDKMSPDLSSNITNYFGTVTQDTLDAGVGSTAIALTIFGTGLPMLTSVGSFFISYLTYNPLKIRQRNQEEMLSEKRDEIRRLGAILIEYDVDEKFAENLVSDDQGNFNEMKKMHRAKVLGYCDYVRQRLKEHLANPTALNALSEENCIAILERLDRELLAFENAEAPKMSVNINMNPQSLTSKEVAA